jgi:hypothetical protein
MKNIQVIDGALNCTFSIFQATEEEFVLIFSEPGQDIQYAEDLAKTRSMPRSNEFGNVRYASGTPWESTEHCFISLNDTRSSIAKSAKTPLTPAPSIRSNVDSLECPERACERAVFQRPKVRQDVLDRFSNQTG